MESFDINFACITLKSGGIILYPTDTIWGLGCDATNAEAVSAIYRLKKRPEKKSMIILASGEEMIRNYVAAASAKLLEYMTAQNHPTTAIFEHAINLPDVLVNDDGTIAIRIVQDEFCLQLIRSFRKPIVSTSANISGEAFAENFSKVSDEIKNGVDYIVQHRQDDLKKYAPSSIVKLDAFENIVFLR